MEAKTSLDFHDFFDDPGWCQFAPQLTKDRGVYPNRLFHNAEKRLGAVVAFRGPTYDSWAVNEAAITYLDNAVHEGRINEGYVILAKNNPTQVIESMEIAAVKKLLVGVPIRDGNFGRYWWVEKFAIDQLAEAPF
jgi:hypothetical protein